jgi:hypothetical protein
MSRTAIRRIPRPPRYRRKQPIRLISQGEAPRQAGGDPGWCDTISGDQGLDLSNLKKAGIENIGESSPVSNLREGLENGNPGALAGATGVDQLGTSFKTEEYRNRAKAATALCHAIAECDRDDAVTLMDAALWDLRAGAPGPVFLSSMQEADEWADFATVSERKAYCLASWNRLPPNDRAAFLAYVTGGGHV